ncbi:hypothetical protein [Hyphobacterium sp.]|uniref:hypothetical protein n=1 Tax=Hyphobacterium sp. TaxID=2004662 RepID=UPI003748F237
MESDETFRRLMADATGKLEDAATIAADGQARGLDTGARTKLTHDIERLAADAGALARAARCVLEANPPND